LQSHGSCGAGHFGAGTAALQALVLDSANTRDIDFAFVEIGFFIVALRGEPGIQPVAEYRKRNEFRS
jgi:hypothetical protein